MGSIADHAAQSPLDMSKLDNITDPKVFQSEMHKMIRENLQSGGFIPPTEGLTTPALSDGNDTGSFFKDIANKVTNTVGAKAFDTADNKYEENRFNFISSEEGYSPSAYNDSLKKRTIGYGFNLSDGGNFSMAARILNKTPAQMKAIRDGKATISTREARSLFEASVSNAESIINNTFKDVPLNSGQRLSLVSLAYNHPALIGPKLTKAIKSGDFAAADFEIRSNSNRYKIKGIQNRRTREADMFSNYSKNVDQHGGSVADFLGMKDEKQTAQTAQTITNPEVDPLETFAANSLNQVRKGSPEVGGLSLVDASGKEIETNDSIMAMVPAHIRMFAEDIIKSNLPEGSGLTGTAKNATIKTADFFSDSEIKGIFSVIGRAYKRNGGKSKGVVEYGDKDNPKDYAKGVSDVSWASSDLSITGSDPEAVIKKTLGQFSWEVDKQGNLIVTDQYNFNDAEKMRKQYPSKISKLVHLTALTGMAFTPGSDVGAYGVIRRAAAFYGSKEGEGVRFKINLGKVDLKQLNK